MANVSRNGSFAGYNGLARNSSQSSRISREVELERHQSMASVMSRDTVMGSQRLLDRLELDDDLPWENSVNPLQQLQQSGLSTPFEDTDVSSEQNTSSVNNFINAGGNNKSSRRSRGFGSLRNSLRLKKNSIPEDDTSAIKTAEALGSTVSQVQRTTPVVVGHTNIDEQAYGRATLEINDEDEGGENQDQSNGQAEKASLSVCGGPTGQQKARPVSAVPVPREDPNELRVKKAIQLRKDGNPREASYQLSIAAHHGSRNAMLLYGLSLRYGYGLRVDPKQSFLWISRAASYDLILDANSNFSVDPFNLKEDSIPKVPPEPEAKAYFELAISYLNGFGVDKNENRALQFFEKSASLGNVEGMSQAGLLWQKKGPHGRKKDLHRSAAWLREAEKRGSENVGNSWIHKEKYLQRKE
ncbi:Dsf2 protein [Saccharomycopsis crataegensis]|uniref:Dsf2 protein n=1 Tax=Saccharomycopsis crataegensis TaxID=43959 RepID=A0AAV5QJ35_9ASCO|nr:Dsf2 protein [Saccharomycopsis crataegensis]